jgi:hypothetical protein
VVCDPFIEILPAVPVSLPTHGSLRRKNPGLWRAGTRTLSGYFRSPILSLPLAWGLMTMQLVSDFVEAMADEMNKPGKSGNP